MKSLIIDSISQKEGVMENGSEQKKKPDVGDDFDCGGFSRMEFYAGPASGCDPEGGLCG